MAPLHPHFSTSGSSTLSSCCSGHGGPPVRSAPLINSASPDAPPTSGPGSAPASQGPAFPGRWGGCLYFRPFGLRERARGPAAGRVGAVAAAHGRWGRARIGAEGWARAGRRGAARILQFGAGIGAYSQKGLASGRRSGADLPGWAGLRGPRVRNSPPGSEAGSVRPHLGRPIGVTKQPHVGFVTRRPLPTSRPSGVPSLVSVQPVL